MKRTLVISTDQFILGGAESYTVRMFAWAHTQKVRMILILYKNAKIDSAWKKILAEYNVEVYYITPYEKCCIPRKIRKEKLEFAENEKVTWISYNVQSFINSCFMRLYFGRINMKIKLYVLHPFTARLRASNDKMEYILNKVFYSILNRHVYFVDDEMRSYNEKKSGVKFSNQIIPIGLNLDNIPGICENKNDKYRILTVSRLDFPMKGYVAGLIKDFEILHKEYPDTTLTIVGDGPGKVKIENIISGLDEDTRNSIELAGSVDYSELGKYYDNCDLYLGQGTTLLEASLRGKIAIVQLAYQYTTISSGFFHNRPMFIGAELNNYSGKRYTALELMREAVNYTQEERKKYGETARKAVWDNYDIRETMKTLMN